MINDPVSQLFQEQTENDVKRWYPTPEMCDDPMILNKMERRNYDEIFTNRGKEHLNPTETDEQRKNFWSKVNWDE